jgi:hypothetical protein
MMADFSTSLVFPGANIVDVNRDTGVCPNPMLLHQGDQIRLSQVTLKGLSHEIDFKNFNKNLQNLA